MSIILVIHIITFSTSIVLTTALLLQTVLGRITSGRVVAINQLVTATGIITGTALLFTAPLGLHCAVLLSYVAAFALASVYISHRKVQLLPVKES